MHGSVIVHYTSRLLITACRHRAVNQVSLRKIAHLLLDQTLSLVPSLPTHCLAFDRLQYAKNICKQKPGWWEGVETRLAAQTFKKSLGTRLVGAWLAARGVAETMNNRRANA